MSMIIDEKEFRAYFKENGSLKASEKYGKHQRTMQRWYKHGVPDSLTVPKITITTKDRIGFSKDYEKAKTTRGGITRLAEQYGVSTKTIWRWNKYGIPEHPRKFKKYHAPPIKVSHAYYALVKYWITTRGKPIEKFWASTIYATKQEAVRALKEIVSNVQMMMFDTDDLKRRTDLIDTNIDFARGMQKTWVGTSKPHTNIFYRMI